MRRERVGKKEKERERERGKYPWLGLLANHYSLTAGQSYVVEHGIPRGVQQLKMFAVHLTQQAGCVA